MNDIDPKLLKIVALAKAGIGGERDAAIALVKKICDREGLNFDDVMSDHDDFREYDVIIRWKNKIEKQIVINVIYKFALTPDHMALSTWNYDKSFAYTTTPSKHLETIHAASIYLRAFRKEQKKIMDDLMSAFLSKHRIFPDYETGNHDDDDTPPDLERIQRQVAIMHGMDDVQIQKQIGG